MIRKMMIGAAALVAVIAAPAAAQYQTTTTSTTTSTSSTTTSTTLPEQPCENLLADDAYSGPANTAITVPAIGILVNDEICPGFSPEVVDGPTHGTLTSFGGDGSFVYQPDNGFTGVDTYTYRVQDEGRKASGKAVSAPATVTLTITGDGGVGSGNENQGGGAGGGGTDLPRTGSNLNGAGLVGAGLLTVGGLLVLSTRKRRREAGSPA